MKKIIIFLFVLTSVNLIMNDEGTYLIPSESIRFRVIANSNEVSDQLVKENTVNKLSNVLSDIESSKNIEETRNAIEEKIPEIETILTDSNLTYNINYGENYFPVKTYKGVSYESGNYESLVIEIGEAKGDNWWCVLYPPLCNLDMQSENLSEIEYSFYLENILNSIK